MRKTAYKLCECLRREKEICQRLSPAFLVGHGQGRDGMDCRGEQEEILKKIKIRRRQSPCQHECVGGGPGCTSLQPGNPV